MANSTVGKIWTVTSVGMLTSRPVKVRKIVYIPTVASDAITFKYWELGAKQPNDTTAEKSGSHGTVGTVLTNAFTSTGAFVTANVVAGDALVIKDSSTGNNLGSYFVVSRDSDNAVTLSAPGTPDTPATMTDETATYTWSVYTGYTGPVLVADSVALIMVELDFGDGYWFPSLGCTATTRAASIAYIYLAP